MSARLENGATSAAEPNRTKVITAVLLYMGFSSTMLITNKAAVKFFPAPSILLFLQMGVSALIVWMLGQLNYLKVDAIEWSKVKAYVGVVVVFIFNLFTNIKALEYSNVETIIVFQTLTSLAVAYGDFKLLNGGLPNNKVILSLFIIVLGAVLYILTDSTFEVEAYFWVFLYFIAKVTDMLYTKHIVDTVPMTSWGRSFYNNYLSLVPVFLMILITNEHNKVQQLHEAGEITTAAVTMVMLSCIVGLGISISGFMCRELISATSFSVVGNMNKILTIFINYVAWEYHASPLGLACLLICLVGGAYYAKVRTEK
jgi:GDP-mannose transporter